ncbi:MAG: HNH endonuclease, partial [Ignavibacteria bacterium]|nr:HNH endonuclease [Ignavibacteria bacterium]
LKMKFTDIDSKWLKKLYEDTNICEVCNRKMKDKSIDHILPLNVGGLHIKSNVRIICLKCNLQRPKNGSDIIQFRLL